MVDDLVTPFMRYLPAELREKPWRAFPLDGKLLLFDRDSGLNVLMEGDETCHVRQIAPRTLLIAVTNSCNRICSFCYRDRKASSLWDYAALVQLCRDADAWGVLEVAFGGGEPLLFPHWDDLINELYATTRLSINFTTNGTLLTEEFLQRIAGHYGQIRLSLYEDNHWSESAALLAWSGARFGVNWLITPPDLPTLEITFARLLELGVRDILLIGYKGSDRALHLAGDHFQRLSDFVNHAYQQVGAWVQLKLDVCWGESLPEVPRLFIEEDCGAGNHILSITSDRHVKPCSFFPIGRPFETVDDLRRYWLQHRTTPQAVDISGCARLPGRGLMP